MTLKNALANLIEGKLTTKVYDKLSKYITTYLYGFKIPPHLTIEDIVSVAITNAYTKRDQFDRSKGDIHTWLYNIARNECIAQDIYQNKREMRIPTNSYTNNIVTTDEGKETSIFETIELEDTTSFDMLFNDSSDISILLYDYILENKMIILEEFLYNKLSNKEIADKHTIPLWKVKNQLYHSRLNCLKHFTGKTQFDNEFKGRKISTKNHNRVNKTPEHLLVAQRIRQKEYNERKKLEKMNQ